MYIGGVDRQFEIIGRKRYWAILSGSLIIIAIIAMSTLGLNLGLEFKGGYLLRLRMVNPASVADVNAIISKYPELSGKSIVQTSDNGNVLILRMPFIEDASVRDETISGIKEDLEKQYGIEQVLQEERVGSEWGKEVSKKALTGLIIFLVLILVYISFRFEFKMAIAAILALIHDIIITLGIYALTRRQVTPATVIAFLTILGYSLYDTIVVFDRVNENASAMARTARLTYSKMVNNSVNQTLTRSINTTLTTMIPIFTILLFGGETLKDFAFALFVGVFFGAYSSVFVAPPILALWKEREPQYEALKVKAERSGAREAVLKKRETKVISGQAAKSAAPSESKPDQKKAAPAGAKATGAKTATAKATTSKKPAQKKTTKGPSQAKKKKKKRK